MRYPHARHVPWKPADPGGRPTFYADRNQPVAVVLHVMQGYLSTARRWAETGHYGSSWHYSIGRDGTVLQHLDHADGGYHAGITAAKAQRYPPPWPLWRGPAVNVNTYTIGIEHEGFAGEPFTAAQATASRDLCRWLAARLQVPLDETHFPPHAAIDPRDRANDFNTPALRRAFYAFLTEGEPMDLEKLNDLEARLARVERLVGGHGIDSGGDRLRGDEALRSLDQRGVSLPLAVDRLNAAFLGNLDDRASQPGAGK